MQIVYCLSAYCKHSDPTVHQTLCHSVEDRLSLNFVVGRLMDFVAVYCDGIVDVDDVTVVVAPGVAGAGAAGSAGAAADIVAAAALSESVIMRLLSVQHSSVYRIARSVR